MVEEVLLITADKMADRAAAQVVSGQYEQGFQVKETTAALALMPTHMTAAAAAAEPVAQAAMRSMVQAATAATAAQVHQVLSLEAR